MTVITTPMIVYRMVMRRSGGAALKQILVYEDCISQPNGM